MKKKIISLICLISIPFLIALLFVASNKKPITIITGEKDLIITISSCNGDTLPDSMLNKLEEKYNGLHFVTMNYPGSNGAAESTRQLKHNAMPDIFLSPLPTSPNGSIYAEQNLIDLSGYEFTQHYSTESLEAISENGVVSYLPMPMKLSGICYNKTLFEEKGWNIPKDYQEWISLCMQIESSGIRPFQMDLEAEEMRLVPLFLIAGCDFLYTDEGKLWEKEFRDGNAIMLGVFEPYLATLQHWLDIGLIRSSDLDTDYETLCQSMIERKCAMTFADSDFANITNNPACTDDFAMTPCYGSSGSQLLFENPRFYVGLNKRLELPENDKKLQISLELLDLLSSVETQTLMSGANDISCVLNVPADKGDFIAPLTDAISDGHVSSFPYYSELAVDGGKAVTNFINGNWNIWEVMSAFSNAVENAKKSALPKLGTVSNSLSNAQTALLVGDAMRYEAYAQIGLAQLSYNPSSSKNIYGVRAGLYKGDIFENDITICMPSIYDIGAQCRVMRAYTTGTALKSILEHGYRIDADNTDSAYFASGLHILYDDNQQILSLTLSDGTEIEPNCVYSLAYIDGSVNPDLLSDATPTSETPNEALAEYIKRFSPISSDREDKQKNTAR